MDEGKGAFDDATIDSLGSMGCAIADRRSISFAGHPPMDLSVLTQIVHRYPNNSVFVQLLPGWLYESEFAAERQNICPLDMQPTRASDNLINLEILNSYFNSRIFAST